MKNILIVVSAIIFLSSCAKSPESIAPAYTSPLTYKGLGCNQIAQELGRVDNALVQSYTQQRNARSNDTMGVILLGLPVSSLSGGNVADQVAKLKGEKEALEKLAVQKNCSIEFKSIPVSKEIRDQQHEIKSTSNVNQ